MEKNIFANKEARAVFVAVALIALVFLITFLRSDKSSRAPASIDASVSSTKDTLIERQISSQDLMKETISRPGELILIDIRDAAEFSKEHLPASQNVEPGQLSEMLARMDKSKTFVFIADSTISSADATALEKIMLDAGADKYFILAGGFSEWKNKFSPTISDGDPNSFSDQAKVTYIKSDQLKVLLGTDPRVLVVDLRNGPQFAEGHIKNAINIPLDELENSTGKIPGGRKIVLCDKDGLWSFKGAVRLYDLGFFNVLSLADGLDTWRQKGFELVK
jgi:rhodanese-related sulfurtransferase